MLLEFRKKLLINTETGKETGKERPHIRGRFELDAKDTEG